MVLDAVLRIKDNLDVEMIHIIKKQGGNLEQSFLDNGFILEKQISIGCKKIMKNAKIMVANTAMDYDKIKIYGAKVKVSSLEKMSEIEQAEKNKMKQKVENILKYGCDVFINRQLIYDYPESLLTQAGVLVIEHADFEGVERL